MSIASVPRIRRALDAYRSAGIRTRFHVWVRLISCPFYHVLRYLPDEGVHLDVGCGHGLLLTMMHFRNPTQRLIGIDVDAKKTSEAARLGLANVQFQSCSLREIQAESVDSISIVDVLYLLSLEGRQDLLAEAWRILRAGGRLVVKETSTTPSWKSRICKLQEILAVKVLRITQGEKIEFLSDECTAELIARAGFSRPAVMRIDVGYPHPHVLFVCDKLTRPSEIESPPARRGSSVLFRPSVTENHVA